jgi:putative selenate reductase
MEQAGVRTVAGFIDKRAGKGTTPAALRNLSEYATRVFDHHAYHARGRPLEAPRTEPLTFFDCESCNACLLTCPNNAFFSVGMRPVVKDTWDLRIAGGEIQRKPDRFEIAEEKQWMMFADFCNECGNCDTFCPQSGGPFRLKPRFYGTRESFEAAAPADGILLEDAGTRLAARIAGVSYSLEWEGETARFSDGAIEVTLDTDHAPVSTRILEARQGHVVSLRHYHALRLLRQAVLKGVNPVSAAFLPVPED